MSASAQLVYFCRRYTTPSMLSKNQIKFVRSLSHKKYRYQERCFLVEGEKLVKEAVHSGFRVRLLVVQEGIEWEGPHHELCHARDMKQITAMSTPPGVIAVVEMPDQYHGVPADTVGFVLDNVSDPGNVGTIIRTALWFGFEHVVLLEGCADPYGHKAVQSSMGAIFRTRIYHANQDDLKKESYRLSGLFLDGESLFEHDFSGNELMVIGNESQGISDEVAELCLKRLTIPGVGKMESLNAAMAMTSAATEWFRRRH